MAVKRNPFAITLLAFFAVCFAGCCQTLSSFRLSDEVVMDVCSVRADATSFRVAVRFRHNTNYSHIIQEGRLADEGITFTEVWRTDESGRIYGKDTHWIENAGTAQNIRRELRVYAGAVTGVDYTTHQFAMIPQNMDGSLITRLPLTFNENYQRHHRIQGRVVAQSMTQGDWVIHWQKPGRVVIETADGKLYYYRGVTNRE